MSINGLSIGKISKIDFLPNTTKILVTMDIREELDFFLNRVLRCFTRLVLLGKSHCHSSCIQLQRCHKKWNTLKTIVKPGFTELINRQIEPLQTKIESMLASADSLFLGVSNVLDNDTQSNLKEYLRKSICYSQKPQ